MFLLMLLATPALGMPTSSNKNNISGESGITSLAVVLSFFSIFSLLFGFKRLFTTTRRLEQYSRNDSLVSLDNSTTSFLPSIHSKISRRAVKSPFFVGLFGSPAWEIDQKLSVCDTQWSQSSFDTTNSRGSRLHEKSSITEFGYATVPPRAITNKSYPLPPMAAARTYPIYSKKHSSCLYRHRRHSLPASTSKFSDAQRGAGNRRHSSLKNNTRRKWDSKVESPRINQDSFSQLSPKENHASMLATASPLTPFIMNPESWFGGSYIPALPSPEPQGRANISLPFALAPKHKQVDVKRPTAHIGPLPHAQALEAAVEYIRSSPKACHGFPSPVILPNDVDYSPPDLAIPFPSKQSSVTIPHPSVSAPPAPRFAMRKSSIHSRKSPTIGPSPLRIMTLPENSLHSLSSSVSDGSSPATYSTVRDTPQTEPCSTYSQLGLGFPSYRYDPDYTLSGRPTNRSRTHSSRKSSRTSSRPLSIIEENDPNMLLGIIRELVEETSQWDTGLFMDEGFKTMIQNSSALSSQQVNKSTNVTMSSSRSFRSSHSSIEVELGLLQLDVRSTQSKLATDAYDDDDDVNDTSTNYPDSIGFAV